MYDIDSWAVFCFMLAHQEEEASEDVVCACASLLRQESELASV